MADEEQEYFGYFYGDDEDKGLMDTAWENQQKKVELLPSLRHELQSILRCMFDLNVVEYQ